MAVEMSEEDFLTVYRALKRVMTPFTEDDVASILKAEREAWTVMKRVALDVGLADTGDADLSRST